MNETGSVRFKCEHRLVTVPLFASFEELNAGRQRSRELHLIGMDSNGIDFGNLSVRDGMTNQFYITGSGTAGILEPKLTDYARVVAYDFGRNWLQCEGSTIASSESLTHAAVYESEPRARVIIHGHNLKLWDALLGQVPTTSEAAEYGTPEMAYEVQRLFQESELKSRKIFVMAGHEGGVVTFGGDFEEAFAVVIALESGNKKH